MVLESTDATEQRLRLLPGLLPGDAVEVLDAQGDGVDRRLGFVQRVFTWGRKLYCGVLLTEDGCVITAESCRVRRAAKQTFRGKPKVSIQIVTFGRPRFLRHALGLIANQDLPRDELEVVVIDDSPECSLLLGALDGVNDDFLRDCVRFVALHQRVSIGAKRNLAVSVSRGEVVMHWDDDDYYGPTRARLQSAPILAGEVDVTLVPLVHSFYTGDACGPDGFYVADRATGGHLCTMTYRRSLWSAQHELRCYADSSLMEDLFFFRNVTGLCKAKSQDLSAGSVDFVYVKHPFSASAVPRVGRPVSRAPVFLPPPTLALLAWLRDATPAPRPAQTIFDQIGQELTFLTRYLRSKGGRVQIPRRFFMDMARMIQSMPAGSERQQALGDFASRLLQGLTSLDSASSAMAAWCCSTLKLPASHEFWTEISTFVCQRGRELAACDVCMLAYVAGRVGLKDDKALVGGLFSLVHGLLGELQPPDVLNLSSAMARLESRDEALLSSLLSLYPQARYSSEEWLRLAWSVSRLQPQWADEKIFPRFISTPSGITQRLFAGLESLGARDGVLTFDSDDVPISLVRGFFTPAECRELLVIAEDFWVRTENTVRKVNVAILNRPGSADHPLVLEIRRRAAAIAGLSPGHCESLHIVRYQEGEQHKPHYDYVQEVDVKVSMQQPEPRMDSLLMGGQRHCTVLVYLTTLERGQGGETFFEHLGVRARPELGAALVWPNVGRDGRPDPRTMHASLPLCGPVKYAVNAWLRCEDVEHLRNVPALGCAPRLPWRNPAT